MWVVWTLAACVAVAQQSPSADGLVPYQFTFKNGDPILYAFVNEADLEKISIPVVIDKPWIKNWEPRNLQRILIDEMGPEIPASRKDRLRREWEAVGGIEVKDREGRPYWVLQSDLDKQTRAQRMSDAAFSRVVQAEPVTGVSGEDMQEGGATGPGFLNLWGAHLAVIAGGLVLAGAVAWLTLRRSWSPV